MLSSINLTIFFLWLVSALADYSHFSYIWQLKEYRWDRFKDFLRSERGRQFWTQYSLLWRSVIALFMFFWPINEVLLLKQIIIVVLVFDILNNIRRYIQKNFHRPRLTYKSAAIIFMSLLIEGVLFIGTQDWAVIFLLLILRFAILSTVVGLFSYPTRAYKQMKIRAARKKIISYRNLKVIGVTGSYGKSSTKEFLAHILSGKHAVIKTPKNINTEIGIAQFILRTDFSEAEYFIVEMGAYTVGEIALICSMVKPRYGILTTIAEEHLALFGSIKNIQKAKYELLRALPSGGFAVTNADNAYCMELLPTITAPYATFGIEKPADAQVTEAKQSKNGIECSVVLRGEPIQFFAPVLGEHNALNIAAALLMAEHLGMHPEEIIKQAQTMVAEHGVIKVFSYGKATIIDDRYNSNPTGFRAALSILGTYPSDRKRIVVTRGMLELGELSDEKHEEIGEEISFIADELVIISPDAADALLRGLVKKYGIRAIKIYDSISLLHYFQEKKKTDAVILLENVMPGTIIKELKQ